MVARMMKWRPWPPISVKKFGVKLVLRKIEGLGVDDISGGEQRNLMAEVRWKGPKLALGSLRRAAVKSNCTKFEEIRDGSGFVELNEEFENVCSLSFHKERAFLPFEIEIRVFNGLKQGHKNKTSIVGMASINLAEFASSAEELIDINLPLLLPRANVECHPSLNLALSLLELRTQESSDTVQRFLVPAPLSPPAKDFLTTEKDELSALKAGLRKVKILTEFVSSRKANRTYREDEGSEGRCSAGSEDAEYLYPFDTDSVDDDLEEGEIEDGKEDSNIRKSFSYGTLATANYVGGYFYSDMRMNGEYEDWVYYSHRRSDVGPSHAEEKLSSALDQTVLPKRSLLPWRKRKLSFRSPKGKGEPLLKKGNGEEGGDDIDYDRRQLSSSDESLSPERRKADDDVAANSSSVSDFGDDNFAIGSWESKEIVSRDGQMKLSTNVFFASIDQRSERAAGESACTALVAVIADWFQSNKDIMPIKSQFDSLIREGSLEWRNLCKNQTYRERFPDKHFDLETVLQAKIRPLSVISWKSFIGFFHPKGIDDCSGFDFLYGAMSFDSIWDEISRVGSELPLNGSQLYIVSWNDHFFVLKVERDAYYIIDTLGERLFEGCDQAYILKFDDSTLIHKIHEEKEKEKDASTKEEEEDAVVIKGKESCKEYIKSFLAAIPIRELQVDIKKGLISSVPLHCRLQIEFQYTEALKETSSSTLVTSESNELVVGQEDQAREVVVPMAISPVMAAALTLMPAVEVV